MSHKAQYKFWGGSDNRSNDPESCRHYEYGQIGAHQTGEPDMTIAISRGLRSLMARSSSGNGYGAMARNSHH